MKLTALFVSVFTLTNAIRVPTSWHSSPSSAAVGAAPKYNRPTFDHEYRTIQQQGSEINPRQTLAHKRSKPRRKLSKPQFSSSQNNWVPILPPYNKPLYNSYQQPIRKTPKVYRKKNEVAPISEHETPQEILTRPIYPGEGLWAKPGKKFKPYLHKPLNRQVPLKLKQQKRPEGYDVFREGARIFEKQRNSFGKDLEEFPEKHKLFAESKEDNNSEETEVEEGKFVPMQLYAQVRRSEDEEHLPASAEDDKLREVIKDSKIQTVYTEEGYEDAAYDHAGHEKNAEKDEGSAEFDKEIEKEKEKKAPKHLPKILSYLNEVGKESDEEEDNSQSLEDLEKYKQEKLSFDEDSDEDAEVAGTEFGAVKSNKNNFIKTKETKTTAVKDMGDGKMEMEISSDVKVILQPNNSTKLHKYVKIFPKMYKEMKSSGEPEKTVTVTPIDDPIVEINETRRKRSAKYPYYNSKNLNPNSPLRYSEDLQNIPNKSSGNMAFYDQADTKMNCVDVESEIDPIPDRVKNAEHNAEEQNESSDIEELVESQRLGQLGDKIDCFKLKYFGENPLDSPFFKEELIEPVPAFFGVTEKEREVTEVKEESSHEDVGVISSIKPPREEGEKLKEISTSTILPINEEIVEETSEKNDGNLISEDKLVPIEETSEKSDSSEDNLLSTVKPEDLTSNPEDTSNANLVEQLIKKYSSSIKANQSDLSTQAPSSISIITTPNYTIDLKPKHIYDQIDLLEYLPPYNDTETDDTYITPASTLRESKNLDLEGTTEVAPPVEEVLPESQALRRRRRPIIIHKRRRPMAPMYHVFDVNQYLPPTESTYLPFLPVTTSMPKYKGVSEVFYKNDIKPIEQLNLFSDIMNNIKNSSRDDAAAEDSLTDYSEPIAVKLNSFKSKRIKVPAKKIRIKQISKPVEAYETIEEEWSTTTSTRKPILAYRSQNKNKGHKNNDQFYEELMVSLKNRDSASSDSSPSESKVVKRRRKPTTEAPAAEEDEEDADYEDSVVGLMPPGEYRYKTIVPKMKTNFKDDEMNLYFVPGLKPPPENQIVRSYSDYKLVSSNHLKRRVANRRRTKRSPNRPAYSELSRNRGKQEEILEPVSVTVEEDDDDYVPHRPKNYYYDEKTGKIVYENVKKEEEPEPEEEEEEEEYVEERSTTHKPKKLKTTTRNPFLNVAPPPEGQSYIDFVNKLKKNKDYHEIPDPTTTEKGAEVLTSTAKPESTTPPEFLAILSKVKADSSYKMIEDNDKTKGRSTTTAAPLEELEEEELEESQLENVQNSPGGQSGQNSDRFQIFDVNDFVPKIKNYVPKTTIDYSKYKTIERPNTRHNLSSRYNLEEEMLEEDKSSKSNPEPSERKYEEPATTTSKPSRRQTTIVPTTTTTTKRLRSRGTRPSSTTTTTPKSTVSRRVEPARHDKPKRTYQRRRPTRIQLRTTTVANLEEDSEDTTKIVRRRSENSAAGFQQPIVVMDRSDEEAERLLIEDRRGRITVPEEQMKNETVLEDSRGKINPRKILDRVEVFNNAFDRNMKHGGNYYKEETRNQATKKNEVVRRLSDVVPKPYTYYTDSKLPKTINQLGRVEDVEQIEDADEEIVEDYYDDAVDINFEEVKATSTKKPVTIIIKDPSKRLYYYANPDAL